MSDSKVMGFLQRNKKSKIKDPLSIKVIKEVRSLLVIVVIVFAFRSTFFEPFKIPSGSMIPTLMIGDFILVNKLSYGIKIPFSDMYSDPIYLFEFGKPKRGDIIVFKYPQDTSFNYIKRVVALPGEKIDVIDKVIYINGQRVDINFVNDVETQEFKKDLVNDFNSGMRRRFTLDFYKTQTGEINHHVMLSPVVQPPRDAMAFSSVTVPEGHYFVMGDNRDFSSDSRFWGFVPYEHIKGRALFVWFSLTHPVFSDYPFHMRPWRIGQSID